MYLTALKKYTVLLAAIVFLVLVNSCKSSGTGPEDNVPAGRRDYVWTVDTLNKMAPYNRFFYLYGTSSSNIWCAGRGDYSDRFLRFDGTKWSFLKGSGPFDPWSLFGFNENDIWCGDYGSNVWRYTGVKFEKAGSFPLEGYGEAIIQDFCGENSTDIMASGCIYSPSHDKLYGILVHYDGKNWNYVIKPKEEYLYTFSKINRGIKDGSNYYISGGTTSVSPDSMSIYEYNGKDLKRIYYEEFSRYNSPGMIVFDGRLYFAFKEKIFKYVNNQFVLLKDFSGNNIMHMGKISGRNMKDLFFDLNGGIGHYNGSDIKPVFTYNTNTQILETLILEKDCYFLCYDRIKDLYLLIHGSLK